MKNKKNILLLVGVVIIWGVLIYKFIDTLNPDASPTKISSTATYKRPANKLKDTFSLQPTKRDPFLGTIYTKPKPSFVAKNNRKSKVEGASWPLIVYQGLVSDSNSSKEVFMVSINSVQHILKSGQTVDEIKILKGNSKSVSIRFQGTTKEFTIQK